MGFDKNVRGFRKDGRGATGRQKVWDSASSLYRKIRGQERGARERMGNRSQEMAMEAS